MQRAPITKPDCAVMRTLVTIYKTITPYRIYEIYPIGAGLEMERSGDAAAQAASLTTGRPFCLPRAPLDKGPLRASPNPSSSSPSATRIPAPRLRRRGGSRSSLEVAAPEQRLIWRLCEFICLKREGPAPTSQSGDWWGV